MGTPFYYRRWLPNSRLSRGWTFFINLLLSVIVMGVFWYGLILGWAGVLALLSWVDFVGFNPWGWPVWLLVALGIGSALGAIGEMADQEYSDVNMYHKITSSHQMEWTLDDKVQKAPPLKTLVLSAGLLDEALMGLSIEPLVYGFLSPVLKERLTPDFFPSAPPIRSGEKDTMLTGTKRLLWSVINYVLAPVTAVLLRALRWWMQPRLTELMLDSASSAGFGLPIHEFSNAVVIPLKELKVPDVFETGDVVDVTQLFAMARLTLPPPATPAGFDFLWDQSALEEWLEKSFTWPKVKPYLSDLKARTGRNDDPFELEVKRLCAIIDVRVREFGGMVELFHSKYYADEQVITAIAQFLEKGVRPESISANNSE